MHARSLASRFRIALIFTALGLVATPALAAPKDAAALKLHDSAMNDDYLAVEFPKAEKKLKDALKLCGGSGCSPAVVAKIHVSLATVYGVGMNKMDQATAEFAEALKIDPSAAPDKALTTPELTTAFEAAKGGGATPAPTSTGPAKEPGGDLPHTPTTESPVNTPVPVYIEIDPSLKAQKVTLRYRPFGGTAWKSVLMHKVGGGYGAEIPCEDTTTTGDIKYYITVADDSGEPVAQAGTLKEPYTTKVKNDLEGEAPHLPDKPPPRQCAAAAECPPGMPGCADTNKPAGGDKEEGATCDTSTECKSGLTCLNSVCAVDTSAGGPSTPGVKKRNVIGLWAQFDMTLFSSKAPSGTETGVCQAVNQSSYSCFYQGTSNQFYGFPDDKVPNTDGISGGFAFADVRALVSYDRQILAKLPLSLGLRFGLAFGGMPSPDNTPQNLSVTKLNWSQATSFPPIHIEARAQYSFGGALYEAGKAHPYVFLGGGLARVTPAVNVNVCDELDSNGKLSTSMSTACPKASVGTATFRGTPRTLDAYQIEGLNFVGIGGGTNFGITDHFGIAAELKIMFMIPTFGVVFSPTIGPIIAF